MSYDILKADIFAWATTYDGPLFHALLCDPPYHLTEIVKRFGSADATPAQYGSDGAFQRASRGFMGKNWDGGDVAFRSETWAALGRILHPGAFGMAFASTRGFHRMACAIEDAGFVVHPMIAWNFASGFPKATRIDSQVDRAAGAEQELVSEWRTGKAGTPGGGGAYNGLTSEDVRRTTRASTPLAQAWAGHRYGLQAMKPAIEPIIVFQKPYQGRPVESITRTGAGALNIDAGRIGRAADDRWKYGVDGDERGNANSIYSALDAAPYDPHSAGRWPANLVLSHSPGCNGHCAPGCPVVALGEQSGERESRPGETKAGNTTSSLYDGGWARTEDGVSYPDDSGTAARFFFNADYAAERLEAADGLIYVPKASTAEREAGLLDFAPTTVDDGRQTPIDNAYLRGETTRRNIHPTVKPIALMRHLATLLLPPDIYAPRRILIPFAGVASEMIGAMFAGWDDVVGVELEADHIPIARARLAYWQQRRWELRNPAAPITIKGAAVVDDGQLDMFAATPSELTP